MKWLPLKSLVTATLLVLVSLGSYALADSIVRSFNASGNIESGHVVALVASDKNSVELAPASNPTRIYGVAVDQNQAPVTAQQPGQNIFVATSGIYTVLVSTENGPIVSGDYLSMSSADGIAAKVKGLQAFVLGRAAEDFDGKSSSLDGGNSGSEIGKISALIAPSKNPALGDSTTVPEPLRRLAQTIAGKTLSPTRIYAALAIFIITILVAFGLLWVGVRGGMIAIGRNPLSKHSIMQNLAQVIIASAIVLIGGLFGIYLLLRI